MFLSAIGLLGAGVYAVEVSEAMEGNAIPGSAEASIDEEGHWVASKPPTIPDPNKPPLSSTVEPQPWQRLTGEWGGHRTKMEDEGVTLDASATLEWSKNIRGGNDTGGASYLQLYNVYITADTEKLFNWTGGTFFLNFQHTHGQSPNDESGAWSATSNIDAGDGRTQISELWVEQLLCDKKLRLKVGKVDANAEFLVSDTAGEFSNGTFTVNATIPMPTFPDNAVSVNAFYQITEQWNVSAGVYDGAGQEGVPTGDHSPATFWGKPADSFLIAQTGCQWNCGTAKLNGQFDLGIWHHTGRFERFDGGEEKGTTGFYVLWNQTLYREKPDSDDNNQGLYAFAHYGYADASVSEASHAAVLGMTYRGLLPSRDADVAGLGVSWMKMADRAGLSHDHECAIEAFYTIQIAPFFSLKPDVQYISNPGASDSDDALVISVRAQLDF